MPGPLLLLAIVAARAPVVTPANVVTVASREIRLGDVLRSSALSRTIRERVIAGMPVGVETVTLKRSALALLVHRAVPSLSPIAADGKITIRLQQAPAPARRCFALNRNVTRDTAVGSEMLTQVPCTKQQAAAMRFSNGFPHAASDLVSGAYLGAVRLAPGPSVRRGDALSVISTAGPVQVTRAVTAMQEARAGRRVFVRDADGVVFAAILRPSGEPE